jgi:rare lipoprotein A
MTVTAAVRGRKPVQWGQVAPAGLLAAIVLSGQAAADPDTAKRGRAPAPIVYVSLAAKQMTADRAPLVIERGGDASAAQARKAARGSESSIPASYSSAPAFNPSASRPATPGARPLAGPGEAEPYAGAPYQIEGRWFVPAHEPDYNEIGVASWYGPGFHGKATASGEVFDRDALTAAHPTLPIPSLVRVTNLSNGRTIVVRLNDRGPYKNDRIIDLSKAAAEALGVTATGTAKVQVQYVGPAPAEPNSVPADMRRNAGLAATSPAEAPAVIGKPFDTGRAFGAGPAPAPVVQAEPMSPIALPVKWPEYRAEPNPVSGPRASPEADAQPPASNHGLYLQAGAFADLANAHRLKDRISGLGPARVMAIQSSKGELYRVVVGPWTDARDRTRVQVELEAIGVNAIAARAP